MTFSGTWNDPTFHEENKERLEFLLVEYVDGIKKIISLAYIVKQH